MVSVIIPTLNAGPSFSELLDCLQRQTVRCEIIVVDSSSSDGTPDVARSNGCRVESILRQQFHHARTRNLGARLAKGDILVFMTQDCMPVHDDCVAKLIAPLVRSEIAASYGRQLPRSGAKPTERFARAFNYPPESAVKGRAEAIRLGIKAFFFSNVCSSVRREAFGQVGGFPEDLTMFEDMRLAKRLVDAGYKIAYVPEAKVIHSHDLGLRDQLARYYQAGFSLSAVPGLLAASRANDEARRFIKEELLFLARNGYVRWIPYALAEAACKFTGFRLGALTFTARRFRQHD